MWSFDILDCDNSVVSTNHLQDIAVVAFGGGWNCSKHKDDVIGDSVDRDNRDSIQICINLNPGVNKFLDRYDKEYFTIENALNGIQRENKALDALRDYLSNFGLSSSSSGSGSSSSNSSSSSSSSSDSYVC